MFKLRIHYPCNIHGTQLLYNSDSYIAFEQKKRALVIKDYYYHHYHNYDFSSGLYKRTKHFRYCSVVQWSKIYELCYEKIDISFSQKSNRNGSQIKKQNRDCTSSKVLHMCSTHLLIS